MLAVARGAGGPPPSNQNATNDKNVTKKTIASSVSVFFSIFAHNTVINYNIDPGSPGPLNFIFTNQSKWAPYNNI